MLLEPVVLRKERLNAARRISEAGVVAIKRLIVDARVVIDGVCQKRLITSGRVSGAGALG